MIALLLALVAGGDPIEVHRVPLDASVREGRLALEVGRPALRGWRARILGAQAPPRPTEPSFASSDAAGARAFDHVCRRLARDGLPATLASVIEILGPAAFVDGAGLERLAEVGLPVDWIACFAPPRNAQEASGSAAGTLVAWIARELGTGRTATDLAPDLTRSAFTFTPSRAGFRVATESGEHAIGGLRLQITAADYFAGVGDGGTLDLVRQLCELVPDADVYASIEEKNLEGFLGVARTWPQERTGRLVVSPEALPVSQWAQDNGKPGFAPTDATRAESAAEVVTLVPRYASRGEDGASFVPGETYVIEGFAALGHGVVQSPLFFQGGNLLAVRDPASGVRTLLVGEAEIDRNRALGLSAAQATEALRLELGVERCLVLPAISFHVDFEVSVRAHAGELFAFVNDTPAAVPTLLECGLEPLVAHSALTSALATRAREHLRRVQKEEALAILGPSVMNQAIGAGRFAESLAKRFALGPADSGVGNLQRFLLALDLLTSTLPDVDLGAVDPHSASYMRSFQRREKQRKEFAATLAAAGMEVVRIPSLSDDERGLNYLNGLHEPGRYLMPAYGGLFAPLDEKARLAFEKALGSAVDVVPVLCGETQRRGGGVHCAVSVLPRP